MKFDVESLFSPLGGINLDHLNIHLVGGAVRDILLGLNPKDMDYAAIGTKPHSLLDLGFKQVGQDFPVFLHPESHVEIALARTERKTHSGHRGFEVCADSNVDLETDLKRRDFTINAMAITRDGQLIDPHNGQKDLEDRILRHVSDAFSEDPLRVLRGVRLMTQLSNFGFTFARETRSLLITMAFRLPELSFERINNELDKIIGAKDPSIGFKELISLNILRNIAPEIISIPTHFRTASIEARFIEWMSTNDANQKCLTSLCERFKLSKQRTQGLLTTRHLMSIESITPEIAINTMTQLGWLRGNKPDTILDTIFHELDSAKITPIPIATWLKYREAARAVTAKSVSKGMLSGIKIGQAIYEERVRVLSTVISVPGTAPGL